MAYSADDVLLLHANGTDGSNTFVEETGKTITAQGNAQIDTAQSVFGGASGLFDGNGDFLSAVDSPDWQLDGGSNENEWTIDFRLRFAVDPGTGIVGLMQQRVDANNDWMLWLNNNLLGFRVRSGGTTIVQIDNAWNPAALTWYHIAVVKNGVTGYMMFVDGTQIGATQTDTSTIPNFAAGITIARITNTAGTNYDLNGWMDEVRISKGVAHWTSNFTPPTSEYPFVDVTGAITPTGALNLQAGLQPGGDVSSIVGTLATVVGWGSVVSGAISSIVGTLGVVKIDAPAYPSAIPVLPVHGAKSEYPKTDDRNQPYSEIEAICAELGVNPKTISDVVTPTANPASFAVLLDMFATIIKAMQSTSNWYDAETGLRKIGWAQGAGATVGASTTTYAHLFASGFGTEPLTSIYLPYDINVIILSVMINTTQPTSGSLVFKFTLDGVEVTTLTLTIAAGSVAGIYRTSHNVVIAKRGQRLGLKVTNNASGASAQIGGIAFKMYQDG